MHLLPEQFKKMGAEGRTPETYIVKGGGLSLNVRDMDSVGAPWLAPDVLSWLDALWEAVLGSLGLSCFYGRAVEWHSGPGATSWVLCALPISQTPFWAHQLDCLNRDFFSFFNFLSNPFRS